MNKKVLLGMIFIFLFIGGLVFFIFQRKNQDVQSSVVQTEFIAETDESVENEESQADILRRNTIRLASDYYQRNEFQRALDLLDDLLIQNVEDQEVVELRDKIVEAKQAEENLDRQQEQDSIQMQQEILRESLDSLGETASHSTNSDELPANQPEEQTTTTQVTEDPQYRLLLETGVRAMQEQAYEEARDFFEEALDIHPDSGEPYARIGEAWFNEDSEGETSLIEAVNNSNKAIENDTNFWLPYYTLAQIYDSTKSYDNAIDNFERASRLNPEDPEIIYQLGRSQYKAGYYTSAIRTFESCLHIDPNYIKTYYPVGLTYIKLRDYSSAITALTKSTELRPTHAASFYELGKLQRDVPNYDAALTSFNSAVSIQPTNPVYLRAQAEIYFLKGEIVKSESSYQDALNLEPSHAATNYNLAKVKLALNKPTEALSFIQTALQQDQASPIYWYTLGAISESILQVSTAITAYTQAITLNPNYVSPMINLGGIYDQQENYDAALAILSRAYELDSVSYQVNNNLGNVYLHKELYQESIGYYKAALLKKPNSTLVLFHLAIGYIEVEQFQLAADTLDKIIKLDNQYWDAFYRYGHVLFTLGKNDQAKAVFQDLLSRNPDYVHKDEVLSLIQ